MGMKCSVTSCKPAFPFVWLAAFRKLPLVVYRMKWGKKNKVFISLSLVIHSLNSLPLYFRITNQPLTIKRCSIKLFLPPFQPQQKDTNHLMRQQQQQHLLMQQQQQQHLYSPAAASDSSGFSERDSSVVSASGFPTMVVHPRNTFSPGHFNNQAAPDLTRSGSPSFFSYQNPALSASPYSTLPRRPPNTSNGGTPGLHSPGALRVNPNFNRPRGIVPPLSLELPSSRPLMPEPAAAFNGRTFQTAKSSTLPPAMPMSTAANQKVTHKITARTPLLEDDRESCV